MRLRYPTIQCLLAVLLAGCTDTNSNRGISSPASSAVASADPAVRPLTAGITIALDMQPDSPTDIPFTTNGKKLKDFVLDDDNASATPASLSFTKVKAGSYTIQAASPPGVAINQINCVSSVAEDNAIDVPNRSVTVELQAGETVSCTFVASLAGACLAGADGTPGCPWRDGDFRIFTQSSWEGTGKSTLEASYNSAFESTFGALTIGDPSGHTATWTSLVNVENFLPQGGAPGILDGNSSNATSTSSHAFGGEAVALTLNVAFSDAGATPNYGVLAFGDIHVCATGTSADNRTVRALLAYVNSLLSFGPLTTINEVYPVVSDLNASFDNGVVSSWGQAHLVNGACP